MMEFPPKVTVLLLSANPSDAQRRDYGTEFRTIEQQILRATRREDFFVTIGSAVRPADLPEYLLRHQPQIVHFCGRCEGSGLTLLQADGTSQHVPAQALGQMFRTFNEAVHLVVLSACGSQEQAIAIAQHVQWVVCATKSLEESSSCAFVAQFYGALAYGRSVRGAFDIASAALMMDGRDSAFALYQNGSLVAGEPADLGADYYGSQGIVYDVLEQGADRNPVKPSSYWWAFMWHLGVLGLIGGSVWQRYGGLVGGVVISIGAAAIGVSIYEATRK